MAKRKSDLPFNGTIVAPGGGISPLATNIYKSLESKIGRTRRNNFISRVLVRGRGFGDQSDLDSQT